MFGKIPIAELMVGGPEDPTKIQWSLAELQKQGVDVAKAEQFFFDTFSPAEAVQRS